MVPRYFVIILIALNSLVNPFWSFANCILSLQNKIRPFSEKLPETVKSIGMCAKDWRCEGTECTYAHSWQERCSWNARLKRKLCVTLTEEGRKKPKLDSACE